MFDNAWYLSGNNGADDDGQGMSNTGILQGKTSVKVTLDLHGATFGTGDDEASIVFIQDNEWIAANVVPYAQNGHNGSQTFEIPLSAFYKVGDTSVLLDTSQPVTEMGTRFWNSGAFTVDITSIKAVTPGSGGGSTSSTYTYDANGNMTSDGVKCYEFNQANQLSKAKLCANNQTIAEYVYDYNGNRMIKKHFSSGSLAYTVYSWTDGFETKVTGGTTETTNYFFVNNELVAKKNTDNSIYYSHNDHLGSSGVLTDNTGAIVETTKFDPWGEVLSGGTKSKFLYTGQEKDLETGLNYYNFRYYNSTIRRFTQPDDIIQDVYRPQDLNRYSYVRNNPLKYNDPTGHNAVIVVADAVIFGLAAGAFTQAAIDSTDTSFWGRVASGLEGVNYVLTETPIGQTAVTAALLGPALGPNFGNASNKYATPVPIKGRSNVNSSIIQPNVTIDTAYKRPSNATTNAQKQLVQGQPCSNCGKIETKMYANHITPLVKEYYQTGKIDLSKMRSLEAINPHCPTCSNKEGGILSGYSKIKAISLGLKK